MSNFKKVKLEDITTNLDKLRIPLSSSERSKLEKIYPYYGAQSIVDYVDRYLFDGDYLLVAEDGENLKSQNSNVCNYVTGKFWVNNHAHILQAKGNNNLKYIYYLLNLRDFRPYVTGSAQPKLTQDNLNKMELLIHEPYEQQKIASVLSALDSKIELNNRINAELEAMAKTLYDYWFVQFDFPFDFAQGKPDKNGKPYKSSGGKMVWNEELKREIPDGWEVKRLEDSMRIFRGASPRPIDDYIAIEGAPWIKISDATSIDHWFIIETKEFIKEEGVKNSRELQPGTLILSNSASPGIPRIVQIRSCVHDGWLIVDTFKDGLYNEYMLFYFENFRSKILNMGTGSIFKNLKTEYIKDLLVTLPSKELLSSSRPIFENISNQILNNVKQNQKLSELRDWLLPMLMNGQVKVRY
jgi:type I restriction enzyme, S subunit